MADLHPRLLNSLRDREGIDFEIDPATGCWEWLKGKNRAGYPHGYAHRRYWEKVNGPRPAGHDFHHLCKNPSCVNPEHVEPVDWRAHDVEHWLTEKGLTLEDVGRIRERGTEPGVTSWQVAEEFGIPEPTVRDYWNGRRWALEFGGGRVRPIGRKCLRCDGDISPERDRKAKYCSPACRTAYNQSKAAA